MLVLAASDAISHAYVDFLHHPSQFKRRHRCDIAHKRYTVVWTTEQSFALSSLPIYAVVADA